MENNNEKYLSLKETIIEMRADIRVIRNMLGKGEKKFEDCNKNISDIIQNGMKNKEQLKQWSEDKFVTKKCFEPIKSLYQRLSLLGLGVLIFLGSIGLGIFMFFKSYFIK